MNCPVCGIEVEQDTRFCANCGANLVSTPNPAPAPEPKPAPQAAPNAAAPEAPVKAKSANTIPAQFKPIGAWGYVGYNLLYSIPIVGFIMLIVFALSNSNYNRRNYARSYFCVMLISAIIAVIVLIIGLLLMILGVVSLNEVTQFTQANTLYR